MDKTTIISICVIVIIAVFYILWRIYKKGLRQTAIDLILLAEKQFSKEESREKMKMVVGGIIAKLPFPLNLIPASMVEQFVQGIFDEVKELLNYRGE